MVVEITVSQIDGQLTKIASTWYRISKNGEKEEVHPLIHILKINGETLLDYDLESESFINYKKIR